MLYYTLTWRDFLSRLDDAQYVVEVVQHPACNAASAVTHVCQAEHFPKIGFAQVLVMDALDILSFGAY